MSDDQVPGVLAELRRCVVPQKQDRTWPPEFFGVISVAANGRTDNARRVENRNEIMPKLTQAIVGWQRDELIAALDAVEVPVGPGDQGVRIRASRVLPSAPHGFRDVRPAGRDHPFSMEIEGEPF